MPKSLLLLGLLAFAGATWHALDSAESDFAAGFLFLLFGFPLLLVVASVAAFMTFRSIRERMLKARTLGIFLASVSVASFAVHAVIWRWLHPPNIHYRFGFGHSETFQHVHFTHSVDGREVEGPWVGGYPLHVRFPDINHDGFPDIRVVGDGQLVEYVYLPQNDGKRFWQLVQCKGTFQVDYPPDGQHRGP